MTRVGITGHRGLTPEIEAHVDREIRDFLAQLSNSDLVGISCIADGADTLFAEAVLDLGGQLIVVVPAQAYRDGLPEKHHPVYDHLYSRAEKIHQLPYQESDSQAHMHASRLLVDQSDQVVAVWDGQPGRGPGGTADVVEYARSHGHLVRIIWPDGVIRP